MLFFLKLFTILLWNYSLLILYLIDCPMIGVDIGVDIIVDIILLLFRPVVMNFYFSTPPLHRVQKSPTVHCKVGNRIKTEI